MTTVNDCLDSAVTEFVGVDEYSNFWDTDFPRIHFRQGEFNRMLHFFSEWTEDERVSTKMSSLSMNNYVSAYFTKWNAYIIEYVSTIDNQICLIDLTIQHLASYYGHRGGKGNLGKKRTEEQQANMKRTEEHRANIISHVDVNKWNDKLASVKSFIAVKGRMPNKRAGDADEICLGKWIARNKNSQKGTSSKREQLMRREVPLTFEAIDRVDVNKWNDKLASVKSFIAVNGRMPCTRAGDADERCLGKWIAQNKFSEKGTNSEREQLMRREVPLFFMDPKIKQRVIK